MYTVHSILKCMMIKSCFAFFLGCNIWSYLIWSQNLDEIYEDCILLSVCFNNLHEFQSQLHQFDKYISLLWLSHCPFFVGMPSLCYYSGGLDSTFLQDMRIKQSFSGFHSSEIKNYAQVNISIENLSFAPLPPKKKVWIGLEPSPLVENFHTIYFFLKASLILNFTWMKSWETLFYSHIL